MGAVKDGFVRMSANIRPNLDLQSLTGVGQSTFVEGHDARYSQGVRNCEGTYFLAMTYKELTEGTRVCGLIVEPTKRTPHEYERVGAFSFDPKVRPELWDFDEENLHMQTITLV